MSDNEAGTPIEPTRDPVPPTTDGENALPAEFVPLPAAESTAAPEHGFALDHDQDAHAGEDLEDEPVPVGAVS